MDWISNSNVTLFWMGSILPSPPAFIFENPVRRSVAELIVLMPVRLTWQLSNLQRADSATPRYRDASYPFQLSVSRRNRCYREDKNLENIRHKPTRDQRGASTALCDRMAARAAMCLRAFEEIEALRLSYPQSAELDAVFWAYVRTRMVEHAKTQSSPGIWILPAKVGAVCAMLGLGEDEIMKLVRTIDVPKLIATALGNTCMQRFLADAEFKSSWSEEYIRHGNPPVRVEFEHAIVFGTISEAGDIAKSKSWGRLIGIQPLRETDELYPRNITYTLKDTSKLRMRWEFRDTFKKILGKDRRLVNEAMRETKRSFLASLPPLDIAILGSKLRLSPDEFWQAVRHGEKFGPNGIARFAQELEEHTLGYRFNFEEPSSDLVQIKPALTHPSPALGQEPSEHSP